jgi:hypothetical protein
MCRVKQRVSGTLNKRWVLSGFLASFKPFSSNSGMSGRRKKPAPQKFGGPGGVELNLFET